MAVQLGSAFGTIEIGTGGAERSVATLANSMRRVGGAMSVAITAPLLLIGKAALSATGDFEQALNTMQVVSGATSEQMDALSATALQLGKDTSFSAGEAAAGMLELAKAGMSAEEVMAAISGTMDLAAAGSLSVAQAAEISANALNAFKLPASDAGRVADILAAAANASSIEVTDLALSFQMASAVFASNGQSIEDLSTAIALLGNNGIKASDAGTSLKAMLIRLTAPADNARAILDELGVAVYNTDGSMRSFEEIVYSLQDATKGLSDEQRNQALTTIFGADAIRAANILINEGAESWQDMETAVSQAGAAQLVADAKMRGLTGALLYAKGTIESALITAFLPFTESLSEMVRTLADTIGKFTELPAHVQKAAIVFAALLAAMGPIILAVTMLGPLLAALLGPIGLIAIGVAALAAAWVADWGGIQGKTKEAISAIMPMFDTVRAWVAERLPVAIAYFQGVWASSVAGIQTIWAALVEFFMPTVERIKAGFDEMISKFGDMGPQFTALWAAAKPILEALGIAIGVTLVAFVYVLANAFAAVMPLLADLVSIAVDAITNTLESMKAAWDAAVKLVTALIEGDWSGAWDAARELVMVFVNGTIANFELLLSVGKALLKALTTFITGILTDMGVDVDAVLATLKTVWDTAWTAIKDYTQTAIDAVIELWETVKTWFTETLPNSLESLRTSFAEKWQKIQESTVNFLNLILGPIKEIGEWLNTKLASAATTLKTFLQSFSIPNPFAVMQGALSAIGDMLSGLSGKLTQIKNFLSTFSIPNPFAGWTLPTMPSWMSNLPGFAVGTNYAPGGMAIVGERGPELINLPRGSQVHPANSPETQNALSGKSNGGSGITNIYNLVANYGYQSPGTLADDITLLQMMAA